MARAMWVSVETLRLPKNYGIVSRTESTVTLGNALDFRNKAGMAADMALMMVQECGIEEMERVIEAITNRTQWLRDQARPVKKGR